METRCEKCGRDSGHVLIDAQACVGDAAWHLAGACEDEMGSTIGGHRAAIARHMRQYEELKQDIAAGNAMILGQVLASEREITEEVMQASRGVMDLFSGKLDREKFYVFVDGNTEGQNAAEAAFAALDAALKKLDNTDA